MEETIISFKTAKLAKEKGLGFNSVRFYYVYDYKKLVHESDNEYNIRHPDYKERFIAVPTQSLLQKWLREEHNIKLWVEPCNGSSTHGWAYNLLIYKEGKLIKNDINCSNGNVNLKYEEALEMGLQESLKQI